MQKIEKDIVDALGKPFPAKDIDWLGIALCGNGQAVVAPYVTGRAIQDRLDDTVGIFGWYNEFRPWQDDDGKEAAQLCGISIYCAEEGRNGWITKWDGAENTHYSPVKGGLTDSMKRAAVEWRIGRYLYRLEEFKAKAEKKGNAIIIDFTELPRLAMLYEMAIRKMFGDSALEGTGIPVFAYQVIRVEPTSFGASIRLLEARTGNQLNVLTPAAAPQLVQGTYLKSAKITAVAQNGNMPAYNTLDSFLVA